MILALHLHHVPWGIDLLGLIGLGMVTYCTPVYIRMNLNREEEPCEQATPVCSTSRSTSPDRR